MRYRSFPGNGLVVDPAWAYVPVEYRVSHTITWCFTINRITEPYNYGHTVLQLLQYVLYFCM